MSEQKLHLVMGGRVKDPQGLEFADLTKIDLVGVYADYAAAEAALQSGNVAGAVPLLAEEAKLGNPVAAFNLGKIYEDGAIGAPDFQQAATYYRIAAEIDTAPR